MPNVRMTKTVVEKLQPKGAETIFWDEALPGFGVRVKASGSRSYIVQYRNRANGRSCRMTIGPHGPLLFVSAGHATGPAASSRTRCAAPIQRRSGPIGAAHPIWLRYAESYLRDHAEKKKRSSSAEDRSRLCRAIHPACPRAIPKVAEIGMNDVQKLHNGLAATPYQANRALALLSKMLSLAIRWGWRSDNPAKGVEKYHEEKRTRWLANDELRRLTAALSTFYPNQSRSGCDPAPAPDRGADRRGP